MPMDSISMCSNILYMSNGPEGCYSLLFQQLPRGALLQSDLAWSGKRCDTYSSVFSTRSRNMSHGTCRLQYGSTSEFNCNLLGLMVLDFIWSVGVFPCWKNFLLELMVKTSLGILPHWKNFQRINHNSFIDYWIIKKVSPILITPE